jgi:acyl-CoA thioesterase FadM
MAALVELTAVHMDTTHRKSCPFPAAILERLRQLVIES